MAQGKDEINHKCLQKFVQLNKSIRVFYAGKQKPSLEMPPPPSLVLQLFLATLPRRFLAKTTFHTFQQENLHHVIGSNWHKVLYGPEALVLTYQDFKAWQSIPNPQDMSQHWLNEIVHDTVQFWLVFFEEYHAWNDQSLLLHTLLLQACYDFELIQDFERVCKIILQKINQSPESFTVYGLGYFFALQ
jgi:hypothetical protein